MKSNKNWSSDGRVQPVYNSSNKCSWPLICGEVACGAVALMIMFVVCRIRTGFLKSLITFWND
jgi:hypothetical protein